MESTLRRTPVEKWVTPVCPALQSSAAPEPNLRLTVTLSPEESEPIIALFEGIAEVEGWQPGGELRANIARSCFFGLWASDAQEHILGPSTESGVSCVIAGLQIVRPDSAGAIPSQRVWPELSLPAPELSAHIAMLAVAKQWRGKSGGLFWLLTAAMWKHCVQSGIRNLYLEATPRTLRCYQRFGWPIQVIGPLREHWGEPCYPCHLSVREVAGALAERAVHSASYKSILANMVGCKTVGETTAHQTVFAGP
jgi:hypothetical protein